jgi:hypothetical protein
VGRSASLSQGVSEVRPGILTRCHHRPARPPWPPGNSSDGALAVLTLAQSTMPRVSMTPEEAQVLVRSLLRESAEDSGKCPSLTIARLRSQASDHEHKSWSRKAGPDNFTIFEGTSEIQRMIIGRSPACRPVGVNRVNIEHALVSPAAAARAPGRASVWHQRGRSHRPASPAFVGAAT